MKFVCRFYLLLCLGYLILPAASVAHAQISSSITAVPQPLQVSSLHLPELFPHAFIGHAPPPLDQKNYNKDHWKNNDGSDKYNVEFGGGIARSAGATRKMQNLGWNVHLGAGTNFNRWVGLSLEYDFNNFGVPPQKINVGGGPYISTSNSRVLLWSFTLDPMVKYYHSEQTEGYIVGGGGFYRKRIDYDFASNCIGCVGPSLLPLDRSNNAGGFNIGTGILWKVSYLEDARYFAEVRYVCVDNQPGPRGVLPAALDPVHQKTGYFPITVGIRW